MARYGKEHHKWLKVWESPWSGLLGILNRGLKEIQPLLMKFELILWVFQLLKIYCSTWRQLYQAGIGMRFFLEVWVQRISTISWQDKLQKNYSSTSFPWNGSLVATPTSQEWIIPWLTSSIHRESSLFWILISSKWRCRQLHFLFSLV